MSDSIGKNEHTEPSGLPLNQERFMQLYDEWDGLGVLERFITDKLIASESALRTLREERDRLAELARSVIHAVKADGYPQFTGREEDALRVLATALGEEIVEPVSVYEHTDKKVARLTEELDRALEALRAASGALEHEGYPEHGWILTEARAVLAKHPAPKQDEQG